jgi:hypothetical protein
MSISPVTQPRTGHTVALNRLTATEVVRAVATGETTCEAVMRSHKPGRSIAPGRKPRSCPLPEYRSG